MVLRDLFFPECSGQTIKESAQMIIQLGVVHDKEIDNEGSTSPKRQISPRKELIARTFLNLMSATQSDYEDHLKLYMIKKHDFIYYVLSQYKECLSNLSQNVKLCFLDYDKYHNRQCLNFGQFTNMVQTNLRMQIQECFSLAS